MSTAWVLYHCSLFVPQVDLLPSVRMPAPIQSDQEESETSSAHRDSPASSSSSNVTVLHVGEIIQRIGDIARVAQTDATLFLQQGDDELRTGQDRERLWISPAIVIVSSPGVQAAISTSGAHISQTRQNESVEEVPSCVPPSLLSTMMLDQPRQVEELLNTPPILHWTLAKHSATYLPPKDSYLLLPATMRPPVRYTYANFTTIPWNMPTSNVSVVAGNLWQNYVFRGSRREQEIHRQLACETASRTAERLCRSRQSSKFNNTCVQFQEVETQNRKQRQEKLNNEMMGWRNLIPNAAKHEERDERKTVVSRRREEELERGRQIREAQTRLIKAQGERAREKEGQWDQASTRARVREMYDADVRARRRKCDWLRSIGIKEEDEASTDVGERRILLDRLDLRSVVGENEDVRHKEDMALRRWIRKTEHKRLDVLEGGERVGFECEGVEEDDLGAGAATWAFCCAGF